MNATAQLELDILGYWHTGSGQGSGYHLDALCERDQQQLPMIPGRQLKGLLRHCVSRAEQWGWLTKLPLPDGPLGSHEELLFGSRSQEEERSATQPGIILVESAHLPKAERQWLAQPEQAGLREELFHALFSTAIDESGSAKRYSLRGTEVCIPTNLHADIRLQATALTAEHKQQQLAYITAGTAWQAINAALPLLDAVGGHRSRGFGEVAVKLQIVGKGA